MLEVKADERVQREKITAWLSVAGLAVAVAYSGLLPYAFTTYLSIYLLICTHKAKIKQMHVRIYHHIYVYMYMFIFV